jgi:hypothetical protein
MSLNSVQHLLTLDNLDRIIGKVTFLVRIVLTICTLLSAIILAITPFTNGEANSHIEVFFFFSAFYSVIWGTIPSMFLLIAIALDNRYRKKTRLHPLRTEVKLLTANIIIILIAVTAIGLLRLNV